jgi:carbonic anhydrase/acetyltransferase-like protein (isoleucine patch superfamily)
MIASYRQWRPDIADSAFIADSAEVIGRVWIGEESGIWYQCVTSASAPPATSRTTP